MRSDHHLRRMVARLPSMPKADFEAIMDSLSEDERGTVLNLLRDLEGDSFGDSALAEARHLHLPLVVPDNLSPWLAARVNGNPAAGDEVVEQFSMTPHATTVLRACAAELVPQPAIKVTRPSLIEQLWQRLAGNRFAA